MTSISTLALFGNIARVHGIQYDRETGYSCHFRLIFRQGSRGEKYVINTVITTDSHRKIWKYLKAAGVLAASAAWLTLAILCWSNGGVSTLPNGIFVEKIYSLFRETVYKSTINTYLSLAGFPLLAFYLTVLIPDLFRVPMQKHREVIFAYKIICVPVLCFAFLCAWAGCTERVPVFSKWLFHPRTSIGHSLQLINLNLIPVCLVLILLTWLLPKIILFFLDHIKNRSFSIGNICHTISYYLVLVGIAVLMTMLSALLLNVLDYSAPDAVRYVVDMCYNDAHYGSACFVTLVLAPVIEEVAFRGLIQNHLKKYWVFPISLLATAVAFGAWHINLGQFVYTFVSAIIWGIIFHASGKIRHTVLLHFLMNFFAVLAYSDRAGAVFDSGFFQKGLFFPALRRWLMNLPIFPTILGFIVMILLIILLEAVGLFLITGKENTVIGFLKRPFKKA